MPYINRIRLVNVNFNDAKGIYDDFSMNFAGKSATYDLINTGGKSVLLLLLMQTVLPNTSLKKEKPIKNIFIGGDTRRTSHCLIEWVLDEGYEYKYMLTGFCARKRQTLDGAEQDSESKLEMDYYNYCYFYNKDNNNDIKSIPLVKRENNQKTYMSYNELKQLLNELKRSGEPAEMFDNRRAYMKYIEYYGLISAEWKLISEINISENYIEKYFKENKTSRKLIENFLVKIIDNVNAQNNDEIDENENHLASTLIKLKDNLMEFRKMNNNKSEYLAAEELYKNLQQKNGSLLEQYKEVEKLNKKAYESYVFQNAKIEELKNKMKIENNTISELMNINIQKEQENDKLKIDKLYNDVSVLENRKDNLKLQKEKVEEQTESAKNKINQLKAQNEYIEYKERKAEVDKARISIEQRAVNDDENEKEFLKYAYNYKINLKKNIDSLNENLDEKHKEQKDEDTLKQEMNKQVNEANMMVGNYKAKIENIEKEIKENQDELDFISREFTAKGKMDIILNVQEALESTKETEVTLNQKVELNNKKILELNEDNVQKDKQIVKMDAEKEKLQSKEKDAEEKIKEYEEKRKSIKSLTKIFQTADDIEMLNTRLLENLQEKEEERAVKQIEQQIKQRKLELMKQYNVLVPNEEIFNIKDKLDKKCTYVTTGIERLMAIKESEREKYLRENPLFIYTIFVDDNSYKKIREGQIEVEPENLVPIASEELLRENYKYNVNDVLFPIQKNVYKSLDNENLEECETKLNKDIETLNTKIQKTKEEENKIREYIREVKDFIEKYTSKVVEELYSEKETISKKIDELNKEKLLLIENIDNNKKEIETLNKELQYLEEEKQKLQDEIKMLEDYIKYQNESRKLRDEKTNLEKELETSKEIANEKTEILENVNQKIESIKDEIKRIGSQKEDNQNKYNNLLEFNQTEVINETFEEIENHFNALNEYRNNVNAELKDLEKIYTTSKLLMEKCEKNIIENGFTVAHFENSNEYYEKVLDTEIENLILTYQEFANKLKEVSDEFISAEIACREKNAEANTLIKILEEKGIQYKKEERKLNVNEIEFIINENSKIMQKNKLDIRKISEKLKELENQEKEITKEHTNLETFINNNNIKPFEIDRSNLLQNEIYSYAKICNETKKIESSVSKLKSNFNSYMQYMKEKTESFFIKQDIIETLQEIKAPIDIEEAQKIENGIKIIIDALTKKIEHINTALENLAVYQSNFITKCLESAENILRDLAKLPGLSKIKIGGKDINIIKLDLFEYEPEEKKNKINDYINNILKEMEENPDEYTKEKLNEKLSSKALLAQITNMDKASVKLYKIEDIESHSAYKKWEDDLGSDGQVNAIYFMFAVCIISYISMLTRKESSNKTKKVIIADNPFGPTSAVFLWEPMFNMLKENNVQLIAPGHNISKEIVSKFEVNYVLKHEYYDESQKSVVVDKEFRTEDDLNNMGFEVIESTIQQSMF